MNSQDCYEISKWASSVANDYNKSITFVLMKLHEAMAQYKDLNYIKSYVLKALNEV